MRNLKKGKFEFIDFKSSSGDKVPRSKSHLVSGNKQIKSDQPNVNCQLNQLNQLNQRVNQMSNHLNPNPLNNQIRISPFDLKQKMPFCYANYSMNNHPSWLNNSDEDNSLKNKISESMVSQIITVDCGDSTTTTQVASSTASSCSLPQNDGSDKSNFTPNNDYECFKSNSPPNKQANKSKSLSNMIDIQINQSFNKMLISGSDTLAPLTLEWNNLSCEISTRKSFLNDMFNCFITNERTHIYNNSESSSLNDLNRDSEASSYQLEEMFKNKKKGKKLILNKQSGQFKSGTISAIIGASGAGKSTLLECISGRRVHGVEGSINVYANTEIFGKNITLAYLGQVETLIKVLTVKEILLFASRLKNYKKIKTYEQHLKLVNSIISEFKLECCANNYIHSISGGQLKRVAIASEIIHGPDIIILDEPTSGLDSCTAYTCIKLLRKITGLVDHQQHFRAPIVICSIHQPSIQLLNEFHNLYVLSNNGRCIYQGSPQNMVKYLAKFNLKCPKYHDPVNFITELASGYYGFEVIHHLAEQERVLQEQRTIELQDNLFIKTNICSNPFKNFSNYAANLPIYDVIGGNGCNNKLDNYVESKSNCKQSKKQLKLNQMNQFHQHQLPEIKTIQISSIIHQMKSQSFPFLYHTLLLTKRTFFGTIREPKLTWLRVFQALFIGFLMSFLYDHPIGTSGGCWSESMAIKEILNPINNLHYSNGLDDNIKSMMNLSSFNSNNLTLIRRLKRDTNNDQVAKIDEFLNQNKMNHELNSKATTGDNVAFVFFVTLFLVMSSMMPTVLTFPSEVRVLQAEKNNGYYSCGSYYVAKVVSDTPFVIFNAILFCAIVYPLTGQLLEWKIFYMFTFVAIVVSLIAHCIGMLFGILFVHSVTSAVFMAPLSMSPVFLFSGFFGKISSLPLFLKPVAYLSYVRYCFECFLISLYGFDRCKISHNKTFFLHRSLHNWTLFQREKDIFFGWNDAETTSLPNLPTDPQALVQKNPLNSSAFNLIPESSRSILSSSLSNDLFKNFSSYVVDKSLLDRFRNGFLRNDFNNTINLPNLLSTNNQVNQNLLTNSNLNNISSIATDFTPTTMASAQSTTLSTLSSLSSTITNTVSNTLSTLSNTLPSSTINPLYEHKSSIIFENFDLSIENSTSIIDDLSTAASSSISPITASSFEPFNESEISYRTFNNVTSSLVLEFYSINDEVFWNNIIFLAIIFVFLRILAYIILVFKTNRLK